MYQLIMVLITISLFSGLLLAGRSYIDPQKPAELERAEFLLSERSRINTGLLAYRIANDNPVPEASWSDLVSPFLMDPPRPLPDGYSWTLVEGSGGGAVCLLAEGGRAIPSTAASILCAAP